MFLLVNLRRIVRPIKWINELNWAAHFQIVFFPGRATESGGTARPLPRAGGDSTGCGRLAGNAGGGIYLTLPSDGGGRLALAGKATVLTTMGKYQRRRHNFLPG